MKGHTGRKHRDTGGANEPEEDLKAKPENRSFTGEKEEGVVNEAEEMKKGGRAKRARGGRSSADGLLEHKPAVKPAKKELGKVEGYKAPMHAGRKPRASGGQASYEKTPGEKRESDGAVDKPAVARASGGRIARARGGSTSDANPFTSARKGTDAPGRKVMKGEYGFGEN